MNTSDLNQIIRMHRLWLAGDTSKGSRADLRYADLRGADLRYANLSGANLSGANLSGADLSGTDLSDADLRYANLRYADLRYANLSDADLRFCTGDGLIIRTIQTGVHIVVIHRNTVSIGCQSHEWEEWMAFDDARIRNMDGPKALTFWRIWKPILALIMEVR